MSKKTLFWIGLIGAIISIGAFYFWFKYQDNEPEEQETKDINYEPVKEETETTATAEPTS